MTEIESMQFSRYPKERLMIESIASRLTPVEKAFRMRLMEYTIDRGAPFNINNGAEIDLQDLRPLIRELIGKRVMVLDTEGNVNFIYPVSALPTNHKVQLHDGRSFSAMCAIDALGAAFTFKQDTRVESRCSECGDPIHVEIRQGRITRLYPDTAHALHVDLNKVDNWAGSC